MLIDPGYYPPKQSSVIVIDSPTFIHGKSTAHFGLIQLTAKYLSPHLLQVSIILCRTLSFQLFYRSDAVIYHCMKVFHNTRAVRNENS